MNGELALKLFQLLDERAPFLISVPLPMAHVDHISIPATPDGRVHLQLEFADTTPHDIRAIVECVLEEPVLVNEPTNSTVLLRPWVPIDFYFQLMLGDDAPDFILYRCTPVTGVTQENMQAGTVIGTASSQLQIAFIISEPSGVFRYLDPAVIIRLLAVFSDDFEVFTDSFREMLITAMALDPVASFGLERFISYHDNLQEPLYRKRLFKDALRLEYEDRKTHLIPTDFGVEQLYTSRLPPEGGTNTLSDQVATSFNAVVDTDPDGFAYFTLTDLNLHFAVFRADRYEMDLLDIRGDNTRFTDVAALTDYKIIVNGPVFDLGKCGFQEPVEILGKKIPIKRALEYAKGAAAATGSVYDYKGLTKGRLVFRGHTETGACSIPRALPGDRLAWRYHFAQSVTGHYQLHLDPIPDVHDYACAFEPVIGVFRQGMRIGQGHEIDMLSADGVSPRKEPDDPYLIKRALSDGIPILGVCSRQSVNYFFVLIRPDYQKWDSKPSKMANWEEMISFLRNIDVVDAFITDGDDSVGLFIQNQGVVLEPGLKKVEVIPLAIGFRKIS